MKLTSAATILSFDPFTVDTGTSNTHNLGEQVICADGRHFRYGIASTTSSVGKMQLAPPPISNHANMAVTATALGSFQINVTPAGTGGNANIYAEGYAVVNAGPGLGATYQVKGHAAITSSTAFNVDLFEPVKNTAWTTATKVTLVHNPYNLFLQATDVTLRGAGVPLVTLAANNYAFLQTRGIASVLADGTIAVGSDVNTGTVAGSVKVVSGTYATDLATVKLGTATIAGVTTEYRPIYLSLQ